MWCSVRTHLYFRMRFAGRCLGLVCIALSGPLTDGVGSVLDREVDFPLAGYAGPGSHTWPSGHIPQDTAPNPLLRIRSPAKKSFGEAFGAATGVSDPRLQKIRIRNRCAGGKAAPVAGYAGPGFHTWPSGHIPQDTAPNPLLRIRSPAKKSFGEAFGAAFPSLCPNGASHTSPGCKPWESTRQHSSRSEGTPHSLWVSDIGPGPPYAVLLQVL
jgi:hypothetical protein